MRSATGCEWPQRDYSRKDKQIRRWMAACLTVNTLVPLVTNRRPRSSSANTGCAERYAKSPAQIEVPQFEAVLTPDKAAGKAFAY